MQPPRGTEHHRKLEALAGAWVGEEKLFPMPWDPDGGEAVGRFHLRIALDGLYLLSDYEQRAGGKTVFAGHGVYGWSASRERYTMHWFDTVGETPPAYGQWEGDTLVFEGEGDGPRGRYTYTILEPDRFSLQIDQCLDGQTWRPFLAGTYRRVAVS